MAKAKKEEAAVRENGTPPISAAATYRLSTEAIVDAIVEYLDRRRIKTTADQVQLLRDDISEDAYAIVDAPQQPFTFRKRRAKVVTPE